MIIPARPHMEALNTDTSGTRSVKPETYKAAIYRGVGKVDVVELPYPPCGDNEAIVRNVLTGICGSDIFAFQKHGPESRIWIDE
jgi:hypothetical protein